MSRNNKSYPYPVLGIGDDIISKSSIHVESVQADSENYYINIHLGMENPDIEQLVNDGYAEYGCEVSCSRTFLLKWFGFTEKDFTIILPRNSVAAKVEFNCRVSVIKDINNYQNSEAHEDYKGIPFNLPSGSVLATFGSFTYNADIEYDRLNSAGSFLTITKGADPDNTSYILDHPKIEIRLPESLYDEYKTKYDKKSSKWGDVFHSSLAFNALVYALLNYDKEAHKDLLWAKTLLYRMDIEPSLKQYKEALDNKYPSDILKLAQALLGNPYKRMLKAIGGLDTLLKNSDANYDTGIN